MPQIVRRFSRRWSFKGNRISNVGDTRIIRVGGNAEVEPPENKRKIKKSKENKIKSAKYTLFNFLPKNLFEQFRRIANAYFLVISAIALFIDSPVSPVTSLIPLLFVVTVTGAKQGYEDWLRHIADNAVNKAPVSVIRGGVERDICCEEIRVGEIVRVQRECEIPCDMLLLSSSDRDRCYVTTANLDGETNLKRLALPKHLLSINVGQLVGKAIIECQQPIADLYSYFGRLELCDERNTTIELNENNLLLRGSRLKNTEWIIGCAVYTGQDTKLSLNSRITINKFSSSEKFINRFLCFYVVIMVFEVIVCYFMKRYYDLYGKYKWDQQSMQSHEHVSDVLQDVFSFMLLYNYLIPISLYVTIEMHKLIGSLFLEWDNDLYSPKLRENVLINTSDLNEELGQVEVLFTDKTGTLTKNEMHFQACSIKGQMFIEENGKLAPAIFEGDAQTIGLPLEIRDYTEDIQEFFHTISLCHTVQIASPQGSTEFATELDSSAENLTNIPEYQASSPDEKALLEACYKFGFQFISEEGEELELRTLNESQVDSMDDEENGSVINHPLSERQESNSIQIDDDGIIGNDFGIEKFTRLETLEFSSDRKRMSVIVQDSNGQIRLLCKGAESAIFPLCTNDMNSEIMAITEKHINEFSKRGLRTLAVAAKTLTMQEYLDIKETLKHARSIMSTRRQTMLITSYRQIEEGLSLLGATAVEDALQDDIEDTVISLRRAGIKIWVLTGDKVETALNIAYSCGHISRESRNLLFLVDLRTEQACTALIRQYAKDISRNRSADFNLVVDGSSLTQILKSVPDEFREIATQCFSVLCCRLSPMQKCQLVQLLKQSKSAPITCAIGDGANDVSMIQEAHIGLGIFGKEGRQAARCADLAFSEFRMLKRIILVHGHWYYQRLATLVQYFFYKNLVFMNIQMLFQISCMFSTQSVYDSTFLTLYNVIYTAFPILILSLSEQKISEKLLLNNPGLYKNNRRHLLLRWPRFLQWTFLGTWHSLVIYISIYIIWNHNSAILQEGRTENLWGFGTALFHCVVLVTNFKLWLYSKYQSYIFILSVILSNATFIIFNIVYSLIYIPIDGDMLGVYIQLLTSPTFWLTSTIVIITCLIPDFLIASLKEMLYKNKRHRTIWEDDLRQYHEVAPTNIL